MGQGSLFSPFPALRRGHGALRAHIESGHIAGAAVDVFPNEPKAKGEPFVSELRAAQRHPDPSCGGAPRRPSRTSAGSWRKLHDYLTLGSTSLSVNLPTWSCADARSSA